MDDIDDVSLYEIGVRRKSARLNKTNMPLPKTPLSQPLEASHSNLTKPKTPQIPGNVTMPDPESAQQVHKPVRRLKGCKTLIPLSPTRRSSRLSQSSKNAEDEPANKGNVEPVTQTKGLKRRRSQPTNEESKKNGHAQGHNRATDMTTGAAPATNQATDNPTGAAPATNQATDNPTGAAPAINQATDNPTVATPATNQATDNHTEDESAHSPPRSPPSALASPLEPPYSLLEPEAGDSEWTNGSLSSASQQSEEDLSDNSAYSEDSWHIQVKTDDGSKRCPIRRRLRDLNESKEASGKELDEENDGLNGDKTARKRKKGMAKSDMRRGRGMAKARKPAAPECRPEIIPVGDAEFTSDPVCTKVVTTVRVLTMENLLGPYRTYNMFPIKARLEILKKFLQRYSWAEGEKVERCLDVYEKIASEAYCNAMTDVRGNYTKKYEKDKSVWKDFPPHWCKNPSYWKGLCLIWSKDKWNKMSERNHDNKKKEPKEINHVAGSRSIFRHKQALVSEKGSAVGLRELFDRTHAKETEAGKVYVNTKAEHAATEFEHLKKNYGSVMSDEELWELAVEGEDSRGQLFGFGNRSRTCKVNQALAAEDATMSDPAKSTATSAEDDRDVFTKSQVAVLIAKKIAAERRKFAADIGAQEKRHNEDLEAFKKKEAFNRACIERLYNQLGATLPTDFDTSSSKGNGSGGA